MINQPTTEMIARLKDIPIYKISCKENYFPILEKPEIAGNFPDDWMTPRLAEALETGDAELILSTGTNHAWMQLIRPPISCCGRTIGYGASIPIYDRRGKHDHRQHIPIGKSGKYGWLVKHGNQDSHDNHETNHAIR